MWCMARGLSVWKSTIAQISSQAMWRQMDEIKSLNLAYIFLCVSSGSQLAEIGQFYMKLLYIYQQIQESTTLVITE